MDACGAHEGPGLEWHGSWNSEQAWGPLHYEFRNLSTGPQSAGMGKKAGGGPAQLPYYCMTCKLMTTALGGSMALPAPPGWPSQPPGSPANLRWALGLSDSP